MSYKAKVFSLLLVTTIFSVSLPAQEPGKHSWDNLQQVRVGQKIEVVDTNLKKLKGTFLSFSDEAISLRVKRRRLGSNVRMFSGSVCGRNPSGCAMP